MSLPRLDHPAYIADRLIELAAKVKSRSRAGLLDGSHILETIAKRFFNALYGWNLTNLNLEQPDYPAVDLGVRERHIAIQITTQARADKITDTAAKAAKYGLGNNFYELIVFFLLPKEPDLPRNFYQLPKVPKIETWDIPDLLRKMLDMDNLAALAKAAKVLDEELGRIPEPEEQPNFDISRILENSPTDLVPAPPFKKLFLNFNPRSARVRRAAFSKRLPFVTTPKTSGLAIAFFRGFLSRLYMRGR